jgi:hypothetical protein
MFVLRAEIVTIFEPKMITIATRKKTVINSGGGGEKRGGGFNYFCLN